MGTKPTHAANMKYLDKLVSLLLSEVFSLSIILRLEYCSGELPLDLVGVFFFYRNPGGETSYGGPGLPDFI